MESVYIIVLQPVVVANEGRNVAATDKDLSGAVFFRGFLMDGHDVCLPPNKASAKTTFWSVRLNFPRV